MTKPLCMMDAGLQGCRFGCSRIQAKRRASIQSGRSQPAAASQTAGARFVELRRVLTAPAQPGFPYSKNSLQLLLRAVLLVDGASFSMTGISCCMADAALDWPGCASISRGQCVSARARPLTLSLKHLRRHHSRPGAAFTDAEGTAAPACAPGPGPDVSTLPALPLLWD